MDYAIARKILFDCFKIDTIDYEEAKVLTVAHDNDRSLNWKGQYYSPLVDTIEDDLAERGVECVSVARIISTIKGKISYGNARSPEGGFARALLAKRLVQVFSRGRYVLSRSEEAIWAKILDVTKAKKVIGIQPSRELCVACHKRGVWVADLQHGVIADGVPWYGEQYRGHEPAEWLPDAFLVWDRGSAHVIDRWASAKGALTKVIGNRWLARFAPASDKDRLATELLAQFRRSAGADERKRILISLSWGDVTIPNGFVDDSLQAVMRATRDRYRWLIRLHPNQIKGFATHEFAKFQRFFEAHLAGFAEWELATWQPLPVVLSSCALHITWASSVCIEAAQLGVKSALLNPLLRSPDKMGNWFKYYTDKGMIELVDASEQSVHAWISSHVDDPRTPERYTEYDQEYRRLLDSLTE